MNITPIKLTTVIPAVLAQIRPAATFMSVKGYTNNFNELSNFGIVFHVNYITAVKKAIKTWHNYRPRNALEQQARLSLLESYKDTLKGYNPRARSAHAYRPITDGQELIRSVKYHDRGQAVHLWGFLVHKAVLRPGAYPVDNRDHFSIVRNELIALTTLSRFRQFKIYQNRFQEIAVEHLTLTQQDLIKELS